MRVEQSPRDKRGSLSKEKSPSSKRKIDTSMEKTKDLSNGLKTTENKEAKKLNFNPKAKKDAKKRRDNRASVDEANSDSEDMSSHR
jgi:hypothetical protein